MLLLTVNCAWPIILTILVFLIGMATALLARFALEGSLDTDSFFFFLWVIYVYATFGTRRLSLYHRDFFLLRPSYCESSSFGWAFVSSFSSSSRQTSSNSIRRFH